MTNLSGETPPEGCYADRVLGCLLGGAVGDAFGYAVEFDSMDAIRRRHGPEGLKDPVPVDGRLVVSDDTQMTLFTAEGLVRAAAQPGGLTAGEALDRIREGCLDWLGTQGGSPSGTQAGTLARFRSLWHRRAPGNTCLSACLDGARGMPEHPINDSKGCGGVMRVAPIGLIPVLGVKQVFGLAARAAAQTHGHPSGYLSAGCLAAIVRYALVGVAPDASVGMVARIAREWQGADEAVRAMEAALALADRGASDRAAAVAELGSGWVGEEALAIGLFAALAGTDFVDTIRIAANHDGDSDSTASIAGQLLGAWHGLSGIPHDWVHRLDVLEPLQEVAGGMIAAFRDADPVPEPVSPGS